MGILLGISSGQFYGRIFKEFVQELPLRIHLDFFVVISTEYLQDFPKVLSAGVPFKESCRRSPGNSTRFLQKFTLRISQDSKGFLRDLNYHRRVSLETPLRDFPRSFGRMPQKISYNRTPRNRTS